MENSPLESVISSESSENGTLSQNGGSHSLVGGLVAGGLAASATFAGIDISSFDPVHFTYVIDPVATAAVPAVGAVGGYVGFNYAKKTWEGIKSFGNFLTKPLSRMLSRGEDDQVIQRATKSLGFRVGMGIGIAGLLGAMLANHYNKLPHTIIDTQQVSAAAAAKAKNVFSWPGKRNVHFIENYLLEGIEESLIFPPEFSDKNNEEEKESWHVKNFGVGFGGSAKGNPKGFWQHVAESDNNYRLSSLKNEEGKFFPIYRFHRPFSKQPNKLHVVDKKVIAPAYSDWIMQNKNGHPDLEHSILKLETFQNGKIYAIHMEGSEDYHPSEYDITIRELGKEKPLFGTPVKGYFNLFLHGPKISSDVYSVLTPYLVEKKVKIPGDDTVYTGSAFGGLHFLYGVQEGDKLRVYRSKENGEKEDLGTDYSLRSAVGSFKLEYSKK